MPRYIRNTVILAKIEATYKTDPVPTGAANAILVSNVTINPLNANNVNRDLIRAYFGGSEDLVGTAYVEATFDVEYQSSATLGTAPAWGPLIRACGFAETIIAVTRVDYLPISTAFESVTIYWYDDGVLHKMLGVRGDFTLKLGIGERPVFSFKFLGIDGGVTAVANATPTLTAWKVPQVITDANTLDVTFGATCSPTGAPALAGGTTQISQGLEISAGLGVNYTPLLGDESIDLTSRDMTGKVKIDLTAANEVTFMATVKAATLQSVGLSHGTVSTLKMIVFAPSVQLINPSKEEVNGRRLIGFDLRVLPSIGNDDLRIVCF
jgi:hypothetical protein